MWQRLRTLQKLIFTSLEIKKSHLATGYIESNLAGTVYSLIVLSVFITNGRNEKIVPIKN